MAWPSSVEHWFYPVFFVALGIFFIVRGRNYLAACTADCHLKAADSEAMRRLEAAVARRVQAEGKPVPLGLWIGWFSILLGIVAATWRVQHALLYAALCFGMTLGVTVVFLRVRNVQPKRVAVLSVRDRESVIPGYWFLLGVVCALMLLAFAGDPTYGIAATIVMLSALVTIGMAWRLTTLPSLLTGEDLAAEQAIDDRLRFYRSRVLFFALAQIFVFCGQFGDLNTIQTIAFVLAAVANVAFAIWILRRQFAMVRLA